MKVGSIKIFGKKYDKEGLFTAILFVSPLLLGILFFYLIPMVQNVFYSFTKWNQFGGYTFIGLENFKKLFSDVAVFQATKNKRS
jgi:multiple sugar transport system permease protein